MLLYNPNQLSWRGSRNDFHNSGATADHVNAPLDIGKAIKKRSGVKKIIPTFEWHSGKPRLECVNKVISLFHFQV